MRSRKACVFCVEKINTVDYKSVNRLRRYISDRARMESGKRTGTCARHQRLVRAAIKRARFMAMLPYAPLHLRVTGPVSTGVRGPGVPAGEVESAEPEVSLAAVDESAVDSEDVSETEEARN